MIWFRSNRLRSVILPFIWLWLILMANNQTAICFLYLFIVYTWHLKKGKPQKNKQITILSIRKKFQIFPLKKKSRPFIGQHCENLSLKGINGKSHVHYMSLHLFCVNSHRMVINGAPFKSHCVYVSCSVICIHSLAMVALTHSTMFFSLSIFVWLFI